MGIVLTSMIGELIAMCAVGALLECFDDAEAEGFRMICGVAVMRTLVLRGVEWLQRII